MSLNMPMISVLIPAHNEQANIAEAIESALHQKTNFPVEVLVIDDGSTDKTYDIASAYAMRHSNLKVLKNEIKKGKGYSIRRAYNAARGQFIHVLDADDIFTNWDKLQKQLDIIIERTDCFAVAHNTLFFSSDDRVQIVPGCKADTVFSYPDCYKNKFYCHTSSYLFRRLENGLPEYFEREAMRGDTALFFFHAYTTRKSVYVMQNVMSVYSIHGQGIWSSLDEKSKSDLNISVLRDLQSLVVKDRSSLEYRSLEQRIAWQEAKLKTLNTTKTNEQYIGHSIDDLIQGCEQTAAKVFRPEVHVRAFQAMYSLPELDALMETVGRTALMGEGLSFLKRRYNHNKVVLLVSGFVPNGGGIFREIKEIIGQLLEDGTRIDILSTGKIDTASEIIDAHFFNPLISYKQLDTAALPYAQIKEALRFLIDASPDRLYPFITHHDVVGLAALQRGLARQIVFDYVYDHGLSLGVHSSAIDRIVAKTESQASALAAVIDPSRIGLLAPFYTERFDANPYRPLVNGTLTTASAAARPYKVENEYRFSYFDVMFEALTTLDMRHIHYGPLSDEIRMKFLDRLSDAGVDQERFVHIPWADNLGRSMLESGVDVFIAPFPVCSARIGIEAMCCGIPSLNHRAMLPGMPEAGDFVDPAQPSWTTPEELILTLSKINAAELSELSASARAYFSKYNSSSVTLRRFVDGAFDAPKLDLYPRFTLKNLAREPFFDSSLAEDPAKPVFDDVEQHKQCRSKFWHRTPTRRRMRSLFRRIRMKGPR